MKKTLIFILMILVLMVSSCNLFLKEEYGELILSFDGSLPDGARALGPDGLPILSTTSMKIDIIREDGYTVTRELSAEEPKSLVELIPVGETIEISVTAYNASSQWSGRTAHTVTSGQNHVRVLLNKNVSGLKNLLFTQTGDGQHGYNLTLYMDGKGIMAPGSNPSAQEKPYSFARDSKGRLYVRYRDTNVRLVRYTSEGNNPETINLGTLPITPKLLMNDFTKGVSYVVYNNSKVYKIEENSVNTTDLATLDFYQGAAAIDDNRVAWTWTDNPSDPLKLNFKNNLESGEAPIPIAIENHINIHPCKESEVKDIFIRGDYVYVLFNTVNDSAGSSDPKLYSLGGIARYNINNLTAPPVKIGFSNSVSFEKGLLKNYDYSENFYGAVKVIGFDEENIYIADDGFDAAYFAENPHIVKNRNRIATLNIATNTLSFSDERTAKWYNEWKERKRPNTKTLLWEKAPDNPSHMRYWTSADGTESFNLTNKLFEYSSTEKPTDVFCYDQDGNLYILWQDGLNYNVRRFELKEDGSYDGSAGMDLNLNSPLGTHTVSAIAVDISGGQNSLYYEKTSSSVCTVKRFKWGHFGHETFDNAEQDTGYSISAPTNGEITALAANKDGVFAGIKETYQHGLIDKYRLKVKKYRKNDGSLDGELTLVDNAPVYTDASGTPIDSGSVMENIRIQYGEAINDLKVFDGVLYALSSKSCETQNKDGFAYFTDAFKNSGILYKIGNTNGPLTGNAVVLAKKDWNDTAKIGYGFYRFIAVKYDEAERIKLIIASDGAWDENGIAAGQQSPKPPAQNYDKVLEYDLAGHLKAERNSGGSFSKTLTVGSGFNWQ